MSGNAWCSEIVAEEPGEARLVSSDFDTANDDVVVTQVESFEEDASDEYGTKENIPEGWMVAGQNFGLNDMEDMNLEVLRIIERLDCICGQFAGHGHDDPAISDDMVDCIENDVCRISNEMEDLFNCGFDQAQATTDTFRLAQRQHNINRSVHCRLSPRSHTSKR
jgi:hypothetical protein